MRAFTVGLIVLVVVSSASAQLSVHGEASAAFLRSGDGYSEYAVDLGRPTFAWRLDLFADALVSDNVAFLSNFRILQDQVLHIDLLALRVRDLWSTGITLEAGQIDIPFNNLGEERFPAENPFFQLPLLHEHISALCESNYDLWTYSPEYAIRGDGVRLLDQGLYDLGVKAYGKVGIIDWSVAVINGTVSATGTYSPGGLNSNEGLGTSVRLAATPFTGFTIGCSYAAGPFMKDVRDSTLSQLYGKSPDSYWQHAWGGDISFSLGHVLLNGELLYNRWQYVQGVNLDAFGYSAEVGYEFTPRITGAIRAGSITFNNVSLREYIPEAEYGYSGPVGYVPYSGPWDHDVFRLEGAASYKIERALLFKVGYQMNRTYHLPHDPYDDVVFVQTVVSFW